VSENVVIKPLAEAAAHPAAGNRALAESAFRMHQPALVAFLGRRLDGDQTTAAELAQDTFVRLIAAPRGLDGGDLRGLIFRIARNLLADGKRRDATRRRTEAAILARDLALRPPAPDRVLADRQALARTLEAIERLPPRCQEVFVLHRFEEMSYAAIASRCGISLSMVEKHIQKALDRIADAQDADV
jgi:RNA polymerase sigma-70 factor (ECF subfamily)